MTNGSENNHFIEVSREAFQPVYPFLTWSVQTRTGLDIEKTSLVDLGGGSGFWLEAMLDAGAKSATLIDASLQMVLYTAERLKDRFSPDRFNAIVGSANAIPLADESQNLIISRSSMHFWPDLPKCWQEMFRILKPGSFAFLGRGYGPDLPDEIRQRVKTARKKLKASKSSTDENSTIHKEELPSPDPCETARIAIQAGFAEVSLIKDHKATWILAKKL